MASNAQSEYFLSGQDFDAILDLIEEDLLEQDEDINKEVDCGVLERSSDIKLPYDSPPSPGTSSVNRRCDEEVSDAATLMRFDSEDNYQPPPTMVSPTSLKSGDMAFCNQEDSESMKPIEFNDVMPSFGVPFSKVEEKELKKVRRRIKNKISAQESRRRKKEYIDNLEKRSRMKDREITELKRSNENLENKMRLLVDELFRHKQTSIMEATSPQTLLKQGKTVTRATQTGMCLQCYYQESSPPLPHRDVDMPYYQDTSPYRSPGGIHEPVKINTHPLTGQNCEISRWRGRENGDLNHSEIPFSRPHSAAGRLHQVPDHTVIQQEAGRSSKGGRSSTASLHSFSGHQSPLKSNRSDDQKYTNNSPGKAAYSGQSHNPADIVYQSDNVILIKDSPSQGKQPKGPLIATMAEDFTSNNEPLGLDTRLALEHANGFQRRSAGFSGHNANTGHYTNTGLITNTNKHMNAGLVEARNFSAHSGLRDAYSIPSNVYSTSLRTVPGLPDFARPSLLRSQSEISPAVFPSPISMYPEKVWDNGTSSRKGRKPSPFGERDYHRKSLSSSYPYYEGIPNGTVYSSKRKRFFSDSDELKRKDYFNSPFALKSSWSRSGNSGTMLSVLTERQLHDASDQFNSGNPVFISSSPGSPESFKDTEARRFNEYSKDTSMIGNRVRSVIVTGENSSVNSAELNESSSGKNVERVLPNESKELSGSISSSQAEVFYPIDDNAFANSMTSKETDIQRSRNDEQTNVEFSADNSNRNDNSNINNPKRNILPVAETIERRQTVLANAEKIISEATSELHNATFVK